MVIAVDFAGTLFEEGGYPGVGAPIFRNIELVKNLQRKHRIVLWTCRDGEPLANAVEACFQHGIFPVAVNENDPEHTWTGPQSKKIYADIYLDDRTINLLEEEKYARIFKVLQEDGN